MPSIEPRGKNSFRLIVEDPSAASSRKQLKETIRVPEELLKAPRKLQNYLDLELAKFQLLVETGEYVKPNRMTFEAFKSEWKKNYADINLGGYTRKNYLSLIDAQLIPEFGQMELGQIKTIHIVKYMAKLRTPEGRKDGRNKPLATNTLLNIYNVLKSIMDCATKWRFIVRNPMEGVDRPIAGKKEKREMKQRKKAYTSEEAKRTILTLCEEPRHWSLYFIGLILGGFRRGEMLAVEWPNVDFLAGGIWIEKQITFDEDGNAVEGEVKTEESAGFVPMPKFYMKELLTYQKEWFTEVERLKLDERWKGGDKQFLFHSGYGEKLYPDAPTRKWGRLREAKKIPPIRLHDLRHTTAMLLREANVDMKTIQERLRHARLETTSDLYTHKSDLVSRIAADKLEKFDPYVLGTDWEQNGEFH